MQAFLGASTLPNPNRQNLHIASKQSYLTKSPHLPICLTSATMCQFVGQTPSTSVRSCTMFLILSQVFISRTADIHAALPSTILQVHISRTADKGHARLCLHHSTAHKRRLAFSWASRMARRSLIGGRLSTQHERM